MPRILNKVLPLCGKIWDMVRYFISVFNGMVYALFTYIISYQLKFVKMRAELSNVNHCAVLFISRAAVNLYWYYIVLYCRG